MAPPLSSDEILAAAWTYCAPQRNKDIDFPRGFWPDVARVAIEMERQQTLEPSLDFRPTMCTRGNAPEPTVRKRAPKKPVDLSMLEI